MEITHLPMRAGRRTLGAVVVLVLVTGLAGPATPAAPAAPAPVPSPSDDPSGSLPRTGQDVTPLAAVGAALLAGGVSLGVVARRRRRE